MSSSTLTPTPRIVPPLKRAGRLVLLTHGVAAVAPDAQAVARQRELADLGPHRAFRHDLVVDVELGRPERLLVLAGLFARELHAERVLAGLQFR